MNRRVVRPVVESARYAICDYFVFEMTLALHIECSTPVRKLPKWLSDLVGLVHEDSRRRMHHGEEGRCHTRSIPVKALDFYIPWPIGVLA